MNKKKKQEKKRKTLQRVVTLVLGLGFAASTLAIALASVFSQNDPSASNSEVNSPTAEEQIQMQIDGYEKVLTREPKNLTALEGLTQIYLLTGNRPKAAATLEKLVKHYPNEQRYAEALKDVQQENNQPAATSEKTEAENKAE